MSETTSPRPERAGKPEPAPSLYETDVYAWSLEQRYRVEEQLQDNPSLKARLGEAVRRAYRRARLAPSSETDMDVDHFPETCPYGWEEIMEREFARTAEQDG